MKVHLVAERSVGYELLDGIRSVFARAAGPLRFEVQRHKTLQVATTGDQLAREEIDRSVAKYRQQARLPEQDGLIAVLKTPNVEDFMMHSVTGSRSAWVRADDWSYLTTASPEAVCSYLLLAAFGAWQLAERGEDWTGHIHEETRGCVWDLCDDWKELSFGLRTGDICEECLALWQRAGVPDSVVCQLVRVLEEVRRQAVCTARFLPPVEVGAKWPFPVATTKYRVAQAKDDLHRLVALLDHFDCMVRFSLFVETCRESRTLDWPERASLGDICTRAQQAGSRALREAVRGAQQDEVVRIRNDHRGHGYFAPEGLHEERLKELEDAVKRVEAALEPELTNTRVIRFSNLDLQANQYTASGSLVMGSNLNFGPWQLGPVESVTERGLCSTGRLYATVDDERRFFPLEPWIRWAECSECHHPRFLLWDGAGEYIDVQVGHRASAEPGRQRASRGR